MMALDIGPGDEVIVPDLTYISTANAVRYVGADPVFADCTHDTWNVNPDSVTRLIGKRTRAIIAVHLLAVPADLRMLRAIADEAGVPLVEDAAETPGASWAGDRVGSVGDLSTFSLYGNKMVSTGEGGVVCTCDDALAARVRKLKCQGADPNRHYWFDQVGYNYRMTNLACAIGSAQLERFHQIAENRIAVRRWYEQAMAEVSPPARLQVCPPEALPSWWMVGALIGEQVEIDRDSVARQLAEAGIETRPFFAALTSLPVYGQCRSDRDCPVARDVAARGIMLPTHTKLGRDDVFRVVTEMGNILSSPTEIA